MSDGKGEEACPAEVYWVQENSGSGMMDAFACNMMSLLRTPLPQRLQGTRY